MSAQYEIRSDDPDRLLSMQEVADRLNISRHTLQNRRAEGKGPRTVGTGKARGVLWSDYLDYLDQQRATPTVPEPVKEPTFESQPTPENWPPGWQRMQLG